MDDDINRNLARIYQRLEEIAVSVAPLAGRLDNLEHRLQDANNALADHSEKDQHIFYGNGQTGLVQRVEQLVAGQRLTRTLLVVLGTGIAGILGETLTRALLR